MPKLLPLKRVMKGRKPVLLSLVGNSLRGRESFSGGQEMGWPAPSDSKNAVKRAGERIRGGNQLPEDMGVLNRWRAAHGYIINTFQATLRTRTRDIHVPVAQRLKRGSTIIDKLRQGRALDLSTMHDIAGIRLVFPNTEDLIAFRARSHHSRAGHLLMNRPEKYDYLAHPKASGYRGIHDVYRYKAGTASGAKWNGLLIEIQYRTMIQHAWATAVELADAITQNRAKFNQGSPDNERFFMVCSELLARKYESSVSCLPDKSHEQLVAEWYDIEQRAHIFQQLRSIAEQGVAENLEGFVLLVISEDGTLSVQPQKSYRRAIQNLLALESQHPDWDIVLASGDKGESLRSAFRNYFRNASEFVDLVRSALD